MLNYIKTLNLSMSEKLLKQMAREAAELQKFQLPTLTEYSQFTFDLIRPQYAENYLKEREGIIV